MLSSNISKIQVKQYQEYLYVNNFNFLFGFCSLLLPVLFNGKAFQQQQTLYVRFFLFVFTILNKLEQCSDHAKKSSPIIVPLSNRNYHNACI